MRAPLIALTTDAATTATDGHPAQRCVAVPEPYVDAVERAGGRPLLLPPSTRPPHEVLDGIDALIVIGGCDVDPRTYRSPTTTGVVDTSPGRDEAELALLGGALERDLPVLGICRGSEMLNIAHAGSVVADLGERAARHAGTGGGFGAHTVDVDPRSRLGAIVGRRSRVHTYHHSGIGEVGRGLRAVAHAADGTVEAVERADGSFAIGVLWHPEMAEHRPLFAALVAAAADRESLRRIHAAAR